MARQLPTCGGTIRIEGDRHRDDRSFLTYSRRLGRKSGAALVDATLALTILAGPLWFGIELFLRFYWVADLEKGVAMAIRDRVIISTQVGELSVPDLKVDIINYMNSRGIILVKADIDPCNSTGDCSSGGVGVRSSIFDVRVTIDNNKLPIPGVIITSPLVLYNLGVYR